MASAGKQYSKDDENGQRKSFREGNPLAGLQAPQHEWGLKKSYDSFRLEQSGGTGRQGINLDSRPSPKPFYLQ